MKYVKDKLFNEQISILFIFRVKKKNMQKSILCNQQQKNKIAFPQNKTKLQKKIKNACVLPSSLWNVKNKNLVEFFIFRLFRYICGSTTILPKFNKKSVPSTKTKTTKKMSAANPVFRLAQLRSKTLKQAAKFHDYNFRMYFLQKTVDTYNNIAKKPEQEIRSFCETQGKDEYLQIKRMAALNAAYAKTPVFLDPKIHGKVEALAAESKAEKALPMREFSSEHDGDGEDGEGEKKPDHHH